MRSHSLFDIAQIKVKFSFEAIEVMGACKQHSKVMCERGGILMGELYPKSQQIIISKAIEVPAESSGSYSYAMDVKAAKRIMAKVWKHSGRVTTYLGDWHTHPQSSPSPSFTDRITFTRNFRETDVPHGLLIYIVVGNHSQKWLWVGACAGLWTWKGNSENDNLWSFGTKHT